MGNSVDEKREYKMSKEFRYYLGGMLDAGSNIRIVRKQEPGGTWSYYPVVRITRKWDVALKALHKRFGGSLSKVGGSWVYEISRRRAYELMKELCGAVIRQKERAQMVIEFYTSAEFDKDKKVKIYDQMKGSDAPGGGEE